MPKRKRKKAKILWHRIFLVLFTIILLIITTSSLIKYINKHEDKPVKDPSSSSIDDNTVNSKYTYLALPNSDVHKGDLIVVNNSFACEKDEPLNLEVILDTYLETPKDERSFYVKDNSVKIIDKVSDALFEMGDAFKLATGETDLMVISGYRSKEYQQVLYDNAIENSDDGITLLVAKPGYSEHQTGLAVDFGIYPRDGASTDFDGTGNFEWIKNNCNKFGFILRFPEKKTEYTGIAYEPWHFRYVGEPHATIMAETGFTLEEYADYLKNYTFEKPHLLTKDSSGKEYDIYFVPMGDGETKIPIPKDKMYTISGNNSDGFIVTTY